MHIFRSRFERSILLDVRKTLFRCVCICTDDFKTINNSAFRSRFERSILLDVRVDR